MLLCISLSSPLDCLACFKTVVDKWMWVGQFCKIVATFGKFANETKSILSAKTNLGHLHHVTT